MFHASKKSIPKGGAESHFNYITRQGRHKGREDLIAVGHINMPAQAESPLHFFQTADRCERANGTASKEWVVALPRGLSDGKTVKLAAILAKELAGDKPATWVVHSNDAALDGGSNPHLHEMISDRVPDEHDRPTLDDGFKRSNSSKPSAGGWPKDTGAKTKRELREKLLAERKLCADVINDFSERYGLAERVDHRSHVDRGLTTTPGKHLGPAAVRRILAQRGEELC